MTALEQADEKARVLSIEYKNLGMLSIVIRMDNDGIRLWCPLVSNEELLAILTHAQSAVRDNNPHTFH